MGQHVFAPSEYCMPNLDFCSARLCKLRETRVRTKRRQIPGETTTRFRFANVEKLRHRKGCLFVRTQRDSCGFDGFEQFANMRFHVSSRRHEFESSRSWCLFTACFIALLIGWNVGSARGELPGGIRVTAQVEPARLAPGMKAELRVTIHLPSGWIVYDLEQVPNSVLPTSIEIDPTEDVAVTETFRSEGAKENIEPKFGSRIARFFDRTPTFRRPLIVAEEARPGEQVVTGHIGFLAQQRATKRFYVISKARFSTHLVIDVPKPSETTDTQPTSTLKELPYMKEAEVSTPIIDAPPPRPKAPAPQFAIQIEEPKKELKTQKHRGMVADPLDRRLRADGSGNGLGLGHASLHRGDHPSGSFLIRRIERFLRFFSANHHASRLV